MPWIKLNETLAKYQQRKELHAAYVCSVAQQVLGDEARVVSFRDGTLTLAVASSPQAANIQIQASHITEAINERAGTTLVRTLRFRVS